MALGSWIELYDEILLNLDNVSAIEKVNDSKCKIYLVSGADDASTIVIPISYENIREIIRMRRTIEVDKGKSLERVIRTINKSTYTPVP